MVIGIRTEILRIMPAVFESLGLTRFVKSPECVSTVTKIEPADGLRCDRGVVSVFRERRPVESNLGQTLFFQSTEACNRFLALFGGDFDGAREPAGQGAIQERVADEKHK